MNKDFGRHHMNSKLEIPYDVPDMVNARIDDTLQNLDQMKRRPRFVKKTVFILAACIVIIGAGGMAALGQGLPLFNSLLKFVNPSAAQHYEEVKESILRQSVTDQDITLTLNDVAYDGVSVIIGFELSKKGGFGDDVRQISIDLLPYFKDPVAGTSADLPNMRIDSYLAPKDNGTYSGYVSMYLSEPIIDIQEHVLTLTTSNIGIVAGNQGFVEVNGLWEIDTKLTAKDIYTTARITESDTEHLIAKGKVEHVKIMQSALNSIINIKGRYNELQLTSPVERPGFFVLDSQGNCLNYTYLSEELSPSGEFNVLISLLRIPEGAEELTVIPYTTLKGKEKTYSADLNKLPITIEMQEQQINISAVERTPQKLLLHYTISGLADNLMYPGFGFADRNGNKITSPESPPRMPGSMNDENSQGVFEFWTDRAQDITEIIVHSPEYNIQEDHKFGIELSQ